MPFRKMKSLSYDGDLGEANAADDVFEDEGKSSQPGPVLNFSIDGTQVPKNPGRPSKDDYSRLLSALYALVLILVGFILPLTEALNENWNASIYNLVFQIYIFTGGIFFLSYLLFFLVPQSNKLSSATDHGTFEAATVKHTKAGIIIQDANAPPPPKRKKRHKKQPDAASAGAAHSRKALHKSEKSQSSRGMVRVSVSASNLNSSDADREYAAAKMGDSALNLSTGGSSGMWDVGDLEENNSNEVYRDISSFGTPFSHDGSSLYLRFGALSEFCIQ